MTEAKEDEGGVYNLAPEPPMAVSTAAACATTLTAEKRGAVKSYLTNLGPALREKYGRKRHYSPAQVRETVLERALHVDYICWALVLHCSPPDFESIHAAAGELCDLAAMRAAIGVAFFDGNTAFATPAVVDVIVSGAAEAAASGGIGMTGWLGEVDWPALLDWA
ncbi:DUF6559 family protein [Zavarzinella formosa]|uniref:DUF6559 family protein n=1 Tax=Zavarzinella formosa TaxID=360055 RepID=UPI0002E6F8E7|nr:DUF6559 family protein [Zavarzinella formosa]